MASQKSVSLVLLGLEICRLYFVTEQEKKILVALVCHDCHLIWSVMTHKMDDDEHNIVDRV